MLQKIEIKNFKSIKNQNFAIKPLTILTGTNSSGKSTFLQSILLFSYYSNQNLGLENAVSKIKNFKDIKNFFEREDNSILKIQINNKKYSLKCDRNSGWKISKKGDLEFEKKLYYISSNRIGQEDIAKYSENKKFGINGENTFGYFQNFKGTQIDLYVDEIVDKTLGGNLKYWFEKILELDIELNTSDIDGENVKVGYKSNKASEPLSTFNVGSGVSYVARILIIALSLKKDDIFLVENPEIHLHPKAISNLADFFVFLASKGIQLIIETHSEHIINKVRHCAYKNKINNSDIIIYYKSNAIDNFSTMNIDKNGKFVDDNGNRIKFAQGFFDANLDDLLELM